MIAARARRSQCRVQPWDRTVGQQPRLGNLLRKAILLQGQPVASRHPWGVVALSNQLVVEPLLIMSAMPLLITLR
jgi:hypothetical protein